MSQGERRIADVRGKIAFVVRKEQKIDDARWIDGRILLSNRRLILAFEGDKQTIPLDAVSGPGGRYDVNQDIASVSDYVSIRHGNNVVLVSAAGSDTFEHDLFSALLDGAVVMVKHPAVKGGVVQETEWVKAKAKLGTDELNMATQGGGFFEVELADVSSVEATERTVREETRRVVEIEHTDEGASVQTYFAGDARLSSIIHSLFVEGTREIASEISLDSGDEEVLMALYSGVSPFEVPELTGRDVDDVEDTYDRLIELDVLEEVRVRRDVALTPRGRNLASDAIDGR